MKTLPLLLLVILVFASIAASANDNIAIVAPKIWNTAKSASLMIYVRIINIDIKDGITLTASSGVFVKDSTIVLSEQECKNGKIVQLHLDSNVKYDANTIIVKATYQGVLLKEIDIGIVRPNKITLQTMEEVSIPADGLTKDKVIGLLLYDSCRVIDTPIQVICEMPGKNEFVFSIVQTDNTGRFTFDLPTSKIVGIGYIQLRVGNAILKRMRIQYYSPNKLLLGMYASIFVPEIVNPLAENDIPIRFQIIKIGDKFIMPKQVRINSSEGKFKNSDKEYCDVQTLDGKGEAILFLNPLSKVPATISINVLQHEDNYECIGTATIYKYYHLGVEANVVPFGKDNADAAGKFVVTAVDRYGVPTPNTPVIVTYTILNDRQRICGGMTNEYGIYYFIIPLSKDEGLCTYQALTPYFATNSYTIEFGGNGRITRWGNNVDQDGNVIFKEIKYFENGLVMQ